MLIGRTCDWGEKLKRSRVGKRSRNWANNWFLELNNLVRGSFKERTKNTVELHIRKELVNFVPRSGKSERPKYVSRFN